MTTDDYRYDLPTETTRDYLVTFPVRDGLVETIEKVAGALRQSRSSWQLEPEGGTHPLVLPVRATHTPPATSRPGADADDELRSLLNQLESLRDPITAVSVPQVIRDPGSKGHHVALAPDHQLGALTRGDLGRVPVAVLAERPPPRRPPGQRRRPVVALLDTKVESHEWLGEPGTAADTDAFWLDAGAFGWDPGPRLRPPDGVDRSGGELGEYEGHGTFCAGLLRQVAPDARVLAVQVARDAGPAQGDHVLNALGWLARLDGNARLDSGDVVCLPASFRPELPAHATYLDLLATVLADLAARGIRVVVAAGNDGSPEPVYPAAFATSKGVPEPVRLVSVGATNADGRTPAYFSNHGDWVTRWEVGTSVVSTFPRVNRAARPELVEPGRQSADPDDFTCGFARWSGTSFAAAVHAGKLAQEWFERSAGPGPATHDVP
jgi:Subtilase family